MKNKVRRSQTRGHYIGICHKNVGSSGQQELLTKLKDDAKAYIKYLKDNNVIK
jgi:hypothetical protein